MDIGSYLYLEDYGRGAEAACSVFDVVTPCELEALFLPAPYPYPYWGFLQGRHLPHQGFDTRHHCNHSALLSACPRRRPWLRGS